MDRGGPTCKCQWQCLTYCIRINGRQASKAKRSSVHTHTRPVRLVTPRKSPNHKCRTCKMLLLNASIKIEIESKSNRDRVWWGARQNQQYRVLERRYATRSGRTLSLSLSLIPLTHHHVIHPCWLVTESVILLFCIFFSASFLALSAVSLQ